MTDVADAQVTVKDLEQYLINVKKIQLDLKFRDSANYRKLTRASDHSSLVGVASFRSRSRTVALSIAQMSGQYT